MQPEITERQKEILLAIYESIKNEGFPPSFEELRDRLDISSNQAIIDHLKMLEKKGYIRREERSARSITIRPLGYQILGLPPLVETLGSAQAGAFTPTVELTGQWQQLSPDIQKFEEQIYLIKVNGDSMINAGIQEGDLLLVKSQKEFTSGDIVVVRTPDGVTVKRFISQDSPPYLFLKPENPKYDVIPFTHEMEMQGKVIGKFNAGRVEQLSLQGMS